MEFVAISDMYMYVHTSILSEKFNVVRQLVSESQRSRLKPKPMDTTLIGT